MTDKAPTNGSDALVAVLHRTGAQIFALAGRFGRQPWAVAWSSMPADRPEAVARWLTDQHVGSVIVVLPASAVVCRTCTLPAAEPEQLRAALQLQAEAHLLTDVPPHRQARAVLPAAPGETTRAGLMIAWPDAAARRGPTGGVPDEAIPGDMPVMYAADVAALAALLNGQRPRDPVMVFDRGDGSLALAISHANGAVLRATRIRVNGAASIARGIRPVIAETALSVGHTPEFTEAMVTGAERSLEQLDRNAGLVLPDELVTGAAERLGGAPFEARWWQTYGIAAGALLAAAGDLAPLTTMLRDAPMERPSRHRQLIAMLSNPRTAAVIVMVAALVTLMAPPAMAGLRLGILKLKLSNLQQHVEDAQAAEKRLALYGAVRGEAWPMTKLLSDIACNTPEAIDLDTIRVRHDRNVSVTGRVKGDAAAGLTPLQVVGIMHENLQTSRIFEDIYINWGDASSFGTYEFTLTAKVARPFFRHRYPVDLDFGRWTLAERLYKLKERPSDEPAVELVNRRGDERTTGDDSKDDSGVEGSGGDTPGSQPERGEPPTTPFSPGGPPAAANDHGPDRPRVRPDADVVSNDRPGSFAGSDDIERRSDAHARGLGANRPRSQDIPQPLSPEQVAAMTNEECQEAWTHIAQALQTAQLDEPTKTRLWEEFRMVKERRRQLRDEQNAETAGDKESDG